MLFDCRLLHVNPIANPGAMVIQGNTRFTVLTSSLIRLEYDPTASFEDRPSQVFWNRELPVPRFSSSVQEGFLIIETDTLTLRHRVDRAFEHHNLSILVKTNGVTWHFGDKNGTNLKGTYRTLDNADGPVDLEEGLNSLSGWSVVDDTQKLVFTPEGWLTPRDKPTAYRDIYFFAYGRDYLACIQDYQKISGKVPLIPRWALGNWWSRYWEYTQEELLELMDEFHTHAIPLSVCIIDMDWHITRTGNSSSGWTGYTWNKALFPDPTAFLAELHTKGLKVSLNLHPADGIHPHEAAYPEFARRLGVDPASQQPIPFDIANPEFTAAYFELLHTPLEEQGVDFWWLDWQQGSKSSLANLDPLFWLNHLHSIEQEQGGKRRPFIFSRWPGFGGHRYPIGFSGDAHVTWNSLDFQPYFTATAANVAFGWWSHDIGGHMSGIEDAELYLRWVQYGVFSPIMRLHSTKNRFHERRPWGYDEIIEKQAREIMQFRHRLVPYIYTTAHTNETQGQPLILPMYFFHPGSVEAYQCPKQYYFGSQLVVAPFTQPIDPETSFSRQVVWLPQGNWFHLFSGELVEGGAWYPFYGRLETIPVFAKAGTILPLGNDPVSNSLENPAAMSLWIYPGKNGEYTLYEDDGVSQAYQQGQYSKSRFEQQLEGDQLVFTIYPVTGTKDHLPQLRQYEVKVFAVKSVETVTLEIDGTERPLVFSFDGVTSQLTIDSFDLSPDQNARITVKGSVVQEADFNNRLQQLETFITYTKMNTNSKALFMRRLPEIMKDPRVFLEIMDNFNESQMLAIAEILFGPQEERISYNKREAFSSLYNRFAIFG